MDKTCFLCYYELLRRNSSAFFYLTINVPPLFLSDAPSSTVLLISLDRINSMVLLTYDMPGYSLKVHDLELIRFPPKKPPIYLNLHRYKYRCRVISPTRDRLMIHDDQRSKRCCLLRVIVGVQRSIRARRELCLWSVFTRAEKSERRRFLSRIGWTGLRKNQKVLGTYTRSILRVSTFLWW